MTQRQIAILSCRVLAMYALILGVRDFGGLYGIVQAFEYIVQETNWLLGGMSLLFSLGPILIIVLAIWLWKHAGLVAAWMTGHDLEDDIHEPDPLPQSAHADEVQAIVLSSLGVWVLIGVLPDIFSLMAWSLYMSTLIESAGQSTVNSFDLNGIVRIVDLIIRFVLGMWLLFGAGRLVPILKKLRAVGLRPDEQPNARDNIKTDD